MGLGVWLDLWVKIEAQISCKGQQGSPGSMHVKNGKDFTSLETF